MPRKPAVTTGAQSDEDAIITAFDALHTFKRHIEDMDVYNEDTFAYLERNGTVEAMDALYDNLRKIYRRVAKGGPIIEGEGRPGLIADGTFRDDVHYDNIDGYSVTN